MDRAQQDINREIVALCVIECARDLLKVQRYETSLDLDVDLTDGGGSFFGDYVMDSLGFVQWMAELEAQLEVPVMDSADSDDVRTLGGLADMIIRAAPNEQLADFCDRWTPARHAEGQ
ncbi:MAG TPA: phosphopantetheine-binding protein [Solirubrobacteraceae bacterium]|jgi:acyl carrier protein|nr:phosphopantetheine-binding protein [Solirubrobacteraceae bacterium]